MVFQAPVVFVRQFRGFIGEQEETCGLAGMFDPFADVAHAALKLLEVDEYGFDEVDRKLYIHPDECIECGACEPECPVTAIFHESAVPDEWKEFTELDARWCLGGEDEKNAEALTTRINDVISRRIAERPELWLWMHDRWKGNASGEIEDETDGL